MELPFELLELIMTAEWCAINSLARSCRHLAICARGADRTRWIEEMTDDPISYSNTSVVLSRYPNGFRLSAHIVVSSVKSMKITYVDGRADTICILIDGVNHILYVDTGIMVCYHLGVIMLYTCEHYVTDTLIYTIATRKSYIPAEGKRPVNLPGDAGIERLIEADDIAGACDRFARLYGTSDTREYLTSLVDDVSRVDMLL